MTIQKPILNQIRVNLLGDFAIQQNNIPCLLPTLTKARLLLVFLFLHPHQKFTRTQLVGLLWPNKSEKRGRRLLSQVLWHINQTMPKLVAKAGDTLQIDSACSLWVDVFEFETVVKPYLSLITPPLTAVPALNKAVDLYKGEFLPGYYQDWLLEDRQRLEEWYKITLTHLITLKKGQQQPQQALELAHKLLQVDPLAEGTHRELMSLYVAVDKPEEALRQFESCRHLLETELGISPGPETLELVDKITIPAPVVETTTPDSFISSPEVLPFPVIGLASAVPLVGRDTELAGLLTYIGNMYYRKSDSGGLVFVEGQPGMGKTKLLKQVARDAEQYPLTIIWGYGQALTALKPFSIFSQILRPLLNPARIEKIQVALAPIWLKTLKQILPDLFTFTFEITTDTTLRSFNVNNAKDYLTRLIEAFNQLFQYLAEDSPLLILLEDIHLLDADSLQILLALGNTLMNAQILLIASHPPLNRQVVSNSSRILHQLKTDALHPTITLPNLDQAATSLLVQRVLNLTRPAPHFEARLYEETQGNPLFIVESLRMLYQEGLLYQNEAGIWTTPFDEQTSTYQELALPTEFSEIIERRLQHLPGNAKQTLQAAAVLGDKITPRFLQMLTNQNQGAVEQTLQELTTQQIFRHKTEHHLFSHDQIEQVVYKQIPRQERDTLHRQVAYLLEEEYLKNLEALAHHFSQGGVWSKAITYTHRVAEMAYEMGAYQVSLDHYNHLLTLLTKPHHLPSGQAHQFRFQIHLTRCELFWLTDSPQTLLADLDELQGLTQKLSDPIYGIKMLNQQAILAYRVENNYNQAQQLAKKALKLAREHHLEAEQTYILQTLGESTYHLGDYKTSINFFTQALACWPATLPPNYQIIQLYTTLQSAYNFTGLFVEAQVTLKKLLRLTETLEDPLTSIYVYDMLAGEATNSGDYIQSLTYAQMNLKQAEQEGLTLALPRLYHNVGFYALLTQNHQLAYQSFELARQLGQKYQQKKVVLACLSGLATVYLYTGCYQKVSHILETVAERFKLDLITDYFGLFLQIAYSRSLLQQGDYQDVEVILGNLQPYLKKIQNIFALMELHLVWGELYLETHQISQANEYFQQALSYALNYPGRLDRCNLIRSYIALCFYKQGYLKKAVSFSQEAVTQIKQIKGGTGLGQIYFNHWQIMQADGDLQSAYNALEQAHYHLQKQITYLPDPAWQANFLNIPLNRQIMQTYQQFQKDHHNYLTVQLPHKDVPTGRPLDPEDYVTVTWTLTAPTDKSVRNAIKRRRFVLCRLLQEAEIQQATPTLVALADALGVSAKTIQRDLAILRQQGQQTPLRGRTA